MMTPVALFAYRRPNHLSQALQSLASNDLAALTDLTIFSDGPRTPQDAPLVAEVRATARSATGFQSLQVIESTENQGLSRSLLQGIRLMLSRHEQIIVLEDDILVGPHFLQFMNDHLTLYRNDASVASIHAYVYPHKGSLPPTFFIRGSDCWGWGTWRRSWAAFEPDGAKLLAELRRRGLVDTLDFEGTAPYEQMLIDQIAGRNDSWAVRWYASALLNEMLTLYPSQPMAINIGEDRSGTHGGSSSTYVQKLSMEPVAVRRVDLAESWEAREAFREFFRARYKIPSSTLGRLLWRGARRLRAQLVH